MTGRIIKNGFLISSILLAAGILLRLLAHELAWPDNYSFAGSRTETAWARMEDAYAQVAMVLMCIGGAMLVVSFTRRLFTQPNRPA